MQTFTKSGVSLGAGATVDLTFDALSAQRRVDAITPPVLGCGRRQRPRVRRWFRHYGVKRGLLPPNDSYAQDEIEGDEILRLSFSTPLNLLGFNVTDFFEEREGGDFGATSRDAILPTQQFDLLRGERVIQH